jgi:hypothetical protein
MPGDVGKIAQYVITTFPRADSRKPLHNNMIVYNKIRTETGTLLAFIIGMSATKWEPSNQEGDRE